ncbi:MAG: CBS domain-containing protein [Nitrospira sp.]|nr:CBS domain-containing protein [Nitrospira sp.]MBX3349844.1 CBS domain-containing protein [Nitrospira sp.]
MGEHGGGLVKEFMHRYLEVVSPKTTVTAVAERMSVKRIGCLLVESDDPTRGPIGILTETDLVRKVLAAGLDPMVTTANQVMVSPIVTITGDRTMLDASHVMETNHIRHLCVAEAGEIVGIVSVRDLVRSFVDAESGPVNDLDQVYRPLSVLMATTLATIPSDGGLLTAAQLMREKRLGSLLTMEAGEIVGIVTECDLVRKGLAVNRAGAHTHISAVMSSPLLSIDVNRTVRDASKAMAEQGVRHLTVTESGKIVGVLSVRDLVKMVSVRDRPRFLSKPS